MSRISVQSDDATTPGRDTTLHNRRPDICAARHLCDNVAGVADWPRGRQALFGDREPGFVFAIERRGAPTIRWLHGRVGGMTLCILERVLKAPSLSQQSRELLIGRDAFRLVASADALRRTPKATRPTAALAVPGLGGTDRALAAMRHFLEGLGHRVHKARLGRQSVDVLNTIPRLVARVREVSAEAGQPISLIGWSVGGVMSREIARSYPELVEQVITFGTPVVGGPTYTAFAWLFSNRQRIGIERRIAERNKIPIERPVTAIWSPNDGVVTPRACIDVVNPRVDHVEVTSTHAGMCLDPDVWRTVAARLDRDSRPQR